MADQPVRFPTPIFSAPQGLLSLLGTKSLGQNPNRMAEEVNGTVNMMPFYLVGKGGGAYQFASQTFTPATRGGSVGSIQVPPGKAWIPIFQSTLSYGTVGGDIIGAQPCLFDILANPVFFHDSGIASGTATATQGLSIPWWQTPVVVPSLWNFGIYTSALTIVGVPTCEMRLTYIELDV